MSLATQLINIIEESEEMLSKFSHQEWVSKPAPDKWSRIEILGHLCDSALNNIHRFIRAQQGDQTNIYYDQDYWAERSNYQNRDVDEVVNLWKALHLQITEIWKKIADEALENTIPVKDETPTLEFLMKDYIVHLEHHLKQIL